MMSFELTSGDVAMICIVVVLVVLPSRLSWLGNAIGRVVRGKASDDE